MDKRHDSYNLPGQGGVQQEVLIPRQGFSNNNHQYPGQYNNGYNLQQQNPSPYQINKPQ